MKNSDWLVPGRRRPVSLPVTQKSRPPGSHQPGPQLQARPGPPSLTTSSAMTASPASTTGVATTICPARARLANQLRLGQRPPLPPTELSVHQHAVDRPARQRRVHLLRRRHRVQDDQRARARPVQLSHGDRDRPIVAGPVPSGPPTGPPGTGPRQEGPPNGSAVPAARRQRPDPAHRRRRPRAQADLVEHPLRAVGGQREVDRVDDSADPVAPVKRLADRDRRCRSRSPGRACPAAIAATAVPGRHQRDSLVQPQPVSQRATCDRDRLDQAALAAARRTAASAPVPAPDRSRAAAATARRG